MRVFLYLLAISFLSFAPFSTSVGQESQDTAQASVKKSRDSGYIEHLDTLLSLQSTISANQMNYTLVYSEDFRLVLSPNQVTNLSFGFSYRYLGFGIGFSPGFLNSGQNHSKKGESNLFNFRTSFNMHRFNLAIDLSSVKGFYLRNSAELKAALPDSPYLVFPDLRIGYFSMLLRYNVNPKFSTAALTGGTQIQRRSALTILPSFQIATFKFRNESATAGLQQESTYSTDLNLLLPVAGTWVISGKFSASLGIGPSFGIDIFRSLAINDSNKVVLSQGTKFITGYSLQTALSYNHGRLFAGLESRYRSYGHKIEDLSRLIKEYSYFQLYVGWRLRAPRFMKKSLDWVNKISPVDLD